MNQAQINEDELQKAIDDITRDSEGNDFGAPEAPSVPPVAPVAPVESVGSVPPTPSVPEMPAMPPMAPVPPAAEAPGMPEMSPINGPIVPPTSPMNSEPNTLEAPASAMPTMDGVKGEAPKNEMMDEVKVKILRDLAPILKDMKINPEQKFRIYYDMITDLNDTSVIENAYVAASEIGDPTAKGEALLKLMEIIDK